MKIPKSHPRYKSLMTRNRIVYGVKKGITSPHGLIAHGRGEAFDYILKEKTNEFAINSIQAAACLLLSAKHPIISVNGNSAILSPNNSIKLSKILNCPLEINIFHSSNKREKKIKKYLEKKGTSNILLPEKNTTLKYLDSNRKYINKNGIQKADVVFVPLEDGDRAAALIKNNKKVITIDLNPYSRTSQTSTISIVDNLIRALPLLNKTLLDYKNKSKKELNYILKKYNNEKNLDNVIKLISKSPSNHSL
tara:strand:- start:1149 stop:1898 length:750 start_codon:yes stop_codon:yes gene_type:complete